MKKTIMTLVTMLSVTLNVWAWGGYHHKLLAIDALNYMGSEYANSQEKRA
ncbi:MAG: hypothetical protein HQM12_04105 [SAR324 cluster bacterium]|nr:hypothetical protein [SAR324 cluster bacterium]